MEQPFYYHIHDPIENFRVKITIRKIADAPNYKDKISPSHNRLATESSNPTTFWTQTFKWQQKIYGPRELLYFKEPQRDTKNKMNLSTHSIIEASKILSFFLQLVLKQQQQKQYRQEIQSKRHEPWIDETQPLVLSTLINQDNLFFSQHKENLTTSNYENQHSIDEHPHGPNIDQQHQGEIQKHRLFFQPTTFKVMYIVASIDIEPDDYQNNSPKFEEIVLCQIKYCSTGMLVMTPGFSEIEEEEIGKLSTYSTSCSPKIRSYCFSSQQGSQYEYTLENASATNYIMDPTLGREMDNLELQEEKRIIQQWSNRCPTTIQDLPLLSEQIKVYFNLELVSALDFKGQKLYITYETVLPQIGWKWNPELDEKLLDDMKAGVTQTAEVAPPYTFSLEQDHPIAHLSFPIELEFIQLRSSLNQPQGSPHILFHVVSRDSWERTYTEGYGALTLPRKPGFYDCFIDTWRPVGGLRDQMTDFFIGGSNQLLDPSYVYHSKDDQSNFNNKYGFRTMNSGKVRIRMNMTKQHFLSDSTEPILPQPKGVVKRGVHEILKSLKGMKLQNSKHTTPSTSIPDLLAQGGVDSILAALKTNVGKQVGKQRENGEESKFQTSSSTFRSL